IATSEAVSETGVVVLHERSHAVLPTVDEDLRGDVKDLVDVLKEVVRGDLVLERHDEDEELVELRPGRDREDVLAASRLEAELQRGFLRVVLGHERHVDVPVVLEARMEL